MNKIVSINQPAYLPWLGYFHRIAISDVFVFFDIVQFEKNSFTNRNKIKMSKGAEWLTVPVKLKNHTQKEIQEIEIADSAWQKDHWKAISLNYKRAKYWEMYNESLGEFYQRGYSKIADFCYEQLVYFLGILRINTQVIRASDLPPYQSSKQDLVIDICRSLKASVYVSGALGKNYISPDKFSIQNIKLYFQDYQFPVHQQLWGDFAPFMSIIDLLFNEGPQSREIIMQNNITKEDLIKKYEK